MDLMKVCSSMVLVILLLLQTVDVCDGIRCYFCVGSGCGDSFDFGSNQVGIHDCNGGQCTKTKSPGGFVVRACSPMKLGNDGCQEQGEFQAVCACSRDLCNGSGRTDVNVFTLAVPVIAAVVGMLL